ncbi:hypothetical protein LLE49_26885 [Alicyclobacillus tolerans]|uniref:hypothetical protein n=1 Tax=Alicyclobacillus tolerans TaxID=90970 RepID=UPI001F37CE16|nr:hypothetical protein [Alicyclobacillus tolerans]MCF8568350.1 hypothetical protein [Alicyclobacillus tolerans]
MQKFRFPSYTTYSVLYLIAISLILTLLLRGKATHPGMVLGLVSIVFGLQLISRALTTTGTSRVVSAAVFIVVEIIACLIVGFGSDGQELWLSTWYAISSILVVVEHELRRFSRRSRRFW